MINFLKYTVASLLGCIIALTLLFFVMMGMLSAMASFGSTAVMVPENSVLEIGLDVPISERAPQSPISNFDYLNLKTRQVLGLNDILANIKAAKTDPRIKGIYLNLSTISAGIATVTEIRNALSDFKTSGKFIISYSDTYSQKAYYLATVADKVYLNPAGDFLFKGMSSQIMFYKQALDKLDIEVQIIRHGKFKSAVEPFILDSMTPENREQTALYVGSIWDCLLTTIAESRNLQKEALNTWIDELQVYSAQSALDKRLVDGLKYKDELLEELAEKTNAVSVDKIAMISLSKYGKRATKDLKTTPDKIAVIYAEGNINMGNGSNGEITSNGLSQAIAEARNDLAVKAIVLRINSGGGSALASDIISREVQLAAEKKPVIASFGDVAASGGYYIAAQAHVIVADPTTITGSIGVFGLIPNVKDFMGKKMGITTDVVNTNKHSDMPTVMRPMTAEERALMQLSVESTYDRFISLVANGRNISKEAVDDIGQGRVWSAVDAKRIGLIDEFGGVADAVRIAADKAGLTDYQLEELPKRANTLEALLSSLNEEVSYRVIRKELGDSYKYYQQLTRILNTSGIQARLPYEIELY